MNINVFGSDLSNKLILYNGGSTAINNGNLIIGSEIFNLNTTDEKLSAGKEYIISLNGNDFRMFYTSLPIVSITTNGASIVDDPKVSGNIYLLENGKKSKSYSIGIELRGGVSTSYPKKSYSVELWKDKSGTEKVKKPLLGMRDDDDWILDGLWNEPIRVRDFTSHAIWLEMGRVQQQIVDQKIGIDRRYCEFFLDGRYQGVYYLGEKIDRKQLKLEKYTTRLEGELYKGYTWADGVTYDGVEDFDNNSLRWSGYEAKYPGDVGEVDWTNLHGLVDFIINSSQADFNSGISSKIDMFNAADYYILLNLLYAADNTGKNVYTARVNSSSLYFFMPWDMDSSFGNNWKGERINVTDRMLSNGLYNRLLVYPAFQNEVRDRWSELRNATLSTTSLKNRFRENYNYLESNGVYIRESLVPGITQNFSPSEIDFIESWIERRASFLDSYFNTL